MGETMSRFVALPQGLPDKRAAAERAGDFDEVYREYAARKAAEQASRCAQCGVPFCQIHCPLHNDIPDWLRLAAEGRLEEAYERSSATNTFPEICGRICPQDRLCEGHCVIEQSGHGAVTIGAIERYVTETAWAAGWVRAPQPAAELPQSVGVLGAGPAGLAAADRLRRRGYQVHVYDRHDRAGGLLIYGIPNFKLEKHAVARRTRLLEEAGVRFHLGFEVGRDASLPELRARHDALLIATGATRARDLQVPGHDLDHVVPAMDYLIASNRKGLGDPVPDFDSGRLDAAGRRVVVIGGGDTAMDCVRTAVRQGAASVCCLYRRDRANMPGSRREVTNAEEEGVRFAWLTQPKAFLGRDGRVAAVRAGRMRLGPLDASGRQAPVAVDGADFDEPADLVILALGFDPDDLPRRFAAPGLEVTRAGTVEIARRSRMSSLPGVFAAGDVVRGASLVVWAIRDGRDAADAIDRYLQRRAREGV
jgi:glutamate synthase (NADPH/NADH) small chain